jgi:O-antigen ligase
LSALLAMPTNQAGDQDEELLAWHAASACAKGWWRPSAYRALRWSAVIGAAALPVSLALGNAALGVALFAALLCRAPLWRAPGFGLALSFTAWCLVSLAQTWRGGTLSLNLAYSWLTFPIAWVVFHDRATRTLAMRLLALTLSAAVVLASVQFTVGFAMERPPLRVGLHGVRFTMASGFLGYHLTFGAVAALLLPLFLAEGRHGLVGGATASLAVVVSVARLAYLGAIGGLGTFAALAAARRGRVVALVLLVCALAGSAMGILAPSKLRSAMELRDGRFAIWEVTATIIQAHPIVGVGGRKAYAREYEARWPEVVGWRTDLPFYEPKVKHAHNSFMMITSMHGLPALGLYLLLLVGLARATYRAATRNHLAGAASSAVLVTYVLAGQFNDLAGQGETAYAFFITLALVLTARRRKDGTRLT